MVPVAIGVRHCPRCGSDLIQSGQFFRTWDQSLIKRYRCKHCGKGCSDSTFHFTYKQKKPWINKPLFEKLTSAISERRSARELTVNQKTVVRRILWMGFTAKRTLTLLNEVRPPLSLLQFDEMETFEHTKCKPLSIPIAVDPLTRWIVAYGVAKMPAKGMLAEISRKKYGPRVDERSFVRGQLFDELSNFVQPTVKIYSDMNPHYKSEVKSHFPDSEHITYKGRRGCVVGYGELKEGLFDPLFTLNHTCAMVRDNIKRLARRTWCTTKKPKRLDLYLALYVLRHNLDLIRNPSR